MKIILFILILIFPFISHAQSLLKEYLKECQLDSLNGQPILFETEVYPEYEGGIQALTKSIAKNIRVTEQAKRMGFHGKITLTFVIDTEGNIQNLCAYPQEVIIDEELISAINKWSVGMHEGKIIPVRIAVPISCILLR